MHINEFINSNPTKQQVAQKLCEAANFYCLSINTLWCFKEFANKYDLTINDFYDDQDSLTEYERTFMGLYNWKAKE